MALDVAEQQDIKQRIGEMVVPTDVSGLPAVRQLSGPGHASLDEALAQVPAFTPSRNRNPCCSFS
jgi:hypothetical protein